jgi:HD-GYP domain-containing protein (c-di-GMP phosphodiesterase class II)
MRQPDRPGVRRAEVLAALSISIDLGLGLPMEHVLRSSLLVSALADELGLDDEQRATTYYANLVLWIGCNADSHEFSRWFGDDLATRAGSYELDWSGLPYLGYLLRRAAAPGRPLNARGRAVLALLLTPRARMAALIHSHCLSARLMSDRVGLPAAVGEAVAAGFERYDGGGLPRGLRGEEIPLATRVVQLADTAEVHLSRYGVSGALAMARARSGTQFDPALVEALGRCRDRLRAVQEEDAWSRALALAPDHDALLDGEELDRTLEAMGDFADLKCPSTIGHSRAVAALAEAAGRHLGLPEDDVRRLRRAGLVHDLGRMGVPNTIWERATPLSESDRERIRLYPYLTGRILDRVRGLEAEAAIAAAHRERLDGSGYPRGVHGGSLSMAQRVLAAADSYRGSLEPRPHRPALVPAEAARRLREEARAGRLDPAAVEAVVAAAGHPTSRSVSGLAGLTPREVEVLCLLARGCPNHEIAQRLSISPKTVRNHLEHVYAKAGVTNRAAAALFAVEHGLVGTPRDGAPAP